MLQYKQKVLRELKHENREMMYFGEKRHVDELVIMVVNDV